MTQFIKTLVRRSIILLIPFFTIAQSTYLPQDSKSDHFLERLEILLQSNPDLNVFTPKPLSRKVVVKVAEIADSLHRNFPYDYFYRLSPTDQRNLYELLLNNSEWVAGNKDNFQSKHPLWHTFYNTKANFYEVNENDFFLALNPVIQQQQSIESGNNERVFLNSKGFTMRGMIANRLG